VLLAPGRGGIDRTRPPGGTPVNFGGPSGHLAAGLVGAWVLNEGVGLTAYNWARKAEGLYHGTLAGTTLPAWSSQGLTWATAVGSVQHGDVLNMGLSDMTWEIIFRTPTIGTETRNLLSKARAAGQVSRYALRVAANTGVLGTLVSWASTTHTDYPFAARVDDGRLYHAVCSFHRATKLTHYLNGVKDSEHDISAHVAHNMISNNPFKIGSYTADNNIADTQQFLGTIELVRVWYRALSPAEVMELSERPYDMFRRIRW